MTELVAIYRHAFPDLRLEITDQIVDEDRVVTGLRMRGTHEHALMGIEPSGHAIDVCAIRVERFANGKIVESWCLLDFLKLLQQLGALPRLQRRPAAQPQ